MKIKDWACADCLEKHDAILAANRKESERKQQKRKYAENKEARRILKEQRTKG